MGLHQGPLGAGMTVEKTSSPDITGTLLAVHDRPETSPVKAFPVGNALAFRPDEGLRWLCTYRNLGDQDVHFGPAPPGEMCFLSLYHFPARGDGVPWTTPGCWQ
jgi:hypothetical protein